MAEEEEEGMTFFSIFQWVEDRGQHTPSFALIGQGGRGGEGAIKQLFGLWRTGRPLLL